MKKFFNESDWPPLCPLIEPEEPDYGVPDVDLSLSYKMAA